MTNPSYTDEQVLDQADWLVGARLLDKNVFSMPIDMGLRTSEKMLRSLLADRQRLQAEVEALRPDRDRLDYIALKGVAIRKAGNGRSNLFVWYQNFPIDGDGPLLNLRTAIDRATPNETKGAKS